MGAEARPLGLVDPMTVATSRLVTSVSVRADPTRLPWHPSGHFRRQEEADLAEISGTQGGTKAGRDGRSVTSFFGRGSAGRVGVRGAVLQGDEAAVEDVGAGKF